MTRRILFWATCLILISPFLLWLMLVLIGPSPGVTKANYKRLKEGMKIEDVQGLFGKPYEEHVEFAEEYDPARTKMWYGEYGNVMIVFDAEGTVEWVLYIPGRPEPTNLLEWLRSLFGK